MVPQLVRDTVYHKRKGLYQNINWLSVIGEEGVNSSSKTHMLDEFTFFSGKHGIGESQRSYYR